MIIGITGTIGAGKGTVVEYLIGQGFVHYSVRSLLTEEIVRRNWPVTRDNMLIVANEFRAISPGYIVEAMLAKANANGSKDSVVESLRSIGEVNSLRKYPEAILLGVDANTKTRYDRVILRKSVTDTDLSYERFLEEESRENQSEDPNLANLPKCITKADYVIENSGDKEELFAKVEEILKKIRERNPRA